MVLIRREKHASILYLDSAPQFGSELEGRWESIRRKTQEWIIVNSSGYQPGPCDSRPWRGVWVVGGGESWLWRDNRVHWKERVSEPQTCDTNRRGEMKKKKKKLLEFQTMRILISISYASVVKKRERERAVCFTCVTEECFQWTEKAMTKTKIHTSHSHIKNKKVN